MTSKTKPEIQAMLKSSQEEVKRLTERVRRVRIVFEEEMNIVRDLEHKKSRKFINSLCRNMPNTENLRKLGLEYYRNGEIDMGLIGIGCMVKLTFKEYLIGKILYKLPDDLILENYPVFIVAYFSTEGRFQDYLVYNRLRSPTYTFHTNPSSVCLGNNGKPYKLSYKDYATILEGIMEVKRTIEVINPASFNCNIHELRNENMKKIFKFTRDRRLEEIREEAKRCLKVLKQKIEKAKKQAESIGKSPSMECRYCGRNLFTCGHRPEDIISAEFNIRVEGD